MNDPRLKSTIPLDEIEHGAIEQIVAALEYDFIKQLAIMPDAHQGYDLPIGAVALLDGYIWPGAVGYDLGCGMCHISTGMHITDMPRPRTMFARLAKAIPVGFEQQKTRLVTHQHFKSKTKIAALTDAVNERACWQLGTLGGGNHFIEIGQDADGLVGITIHSGSRRAGWLIGDFYMRITKGPVSLDSEWGQAYLHDMNWALTYALDNRKQMMRKCLEVLGLDQSHMSRIINENHNHAIVTHDGVLHRKGATPAEKGQLGIIPANMRDGVWITEGLGNEEFLRSASHGAGRQMGRKAALAHLDAKSEFESMDGIIWPQEDGMLDEAPGAYKPINTVLKAQKGILVNITNHFKPRVVLKG